MDKLVAHSEWYRLWAMARGCYGIRQQRRARRRLTVMMLDLRRASYPKLADQIATVIRESFRRERRQGGHG